MIFITILWHKSEPFIDVSHGGAQNLFQLEGIYICSYERELKMLRTYNGRFDAHIA